MIHISVEEHNNVISRMKITGHAGSAEYGRDLVCAAVSAIGFGLGNALDEMNADAETQIHDNLIEITVTKPDEKAQIILQTGLIQLETLREVSSQYMEINKREV